MLNRRRRHQTPTFLEGTPGLYVRRESPPRIPSTAPIPTKGDVTPRSSGGGGGQSNASRSLSGSHSSLAYGGNNVGVTRKAVISLGASTPALARSALYASAASIATTTAVPLGSGVADPPPTINNFSSVQNFAIVPSLQSNYRQLSNVPQLHTQLQQRGNNNSNGRSVALSNPDGGQRRVAARRELSSHSFNNPPSTSWTAARTAVAIAAVRPIALHAPARKNSSVDASENVASIEYRQNSRRRHLATSLSYGNVTESLQEVDQPYVPKGAAVLKLSRVNTTARFENMLRQKYVTSAGSTVASHAKGNAASGQFSSTSLQSLPGSSILREPSVVSSSRVMPSPTTLQQLQHHVRLNSGSSVNDPESELELPPNWEVEVTPDGIRYYVDHNNRRTHWIHPLASENLLPGWIKIFDSAHGVVYYNKIEKRSQFEHPGLATQSLHFNSYYNSTPYHTNSQLHQSQILEEYPPGVLQEPIDSTSKAVEEDLNIIDDKEESSDVPEWIRLYSEAPFESDHLLNWKMFDISQLEEFDQMLMKLFKQDAINTVIKYERPRREINDALMARNVVIS